VENLSHRPGPLSLRLSLLGEYRVEIGAMGAPSLSSVENSTKMDSSIFKSEDVPTHRPEAGDRLVV